MSIDWNALAQPVAIDWSEHINYIDRNFTDVSISLRYELFLIFGKSIYPLIDGSIYTDENMIDTHALAWEFMPYTLTLNERGLWSDDDMREWLETEKADLMQKIKRFLRQ